MKLNSHKTYLAVLGSLALLTILIFKQPFLHHWDSFVYDLNIINGTPSGLGFGRIGYMYPFHLIWIFLSALGLPAKNFFHVILFSNTIFGTLTPLLIYGLAFFITNKKNTAFLAGLIYTFTFGYLNIVTGAMPEPMMYFFTLLSFNFIIYGLQSSKKHLIFIGAAIFGYSFLIKEHALLNSLFPITIFLIYLKQKGKKFLPTLIISALISIAIISIAPIHNYFTSNTSLTETLTNPQIIPSAFTEQNEVQIESINSTESPDQNLYLKKSKIIISSLQDNFGLLNLILAILGLATLIIKKRKTQLLLTFALFAPITIHLFIGFLTPRYFIQYHHALAIFAAIGLTYIIEIFSKKSTTSIIIGLLLSAINLLPIAQNLYLKKLSAANIKQYGEFITQNIEPNSVLIMGKLSTMFEHHFKPFNKKNWKIISSGWAWPGPEIEGIIVANIINGNPVYTNPSFLPSDEKQHFDHALRSFDLTPITPDLYQFTIKPEIKSKLDAKIAESPTRIIINEHFLNLIHEN